MPGVLTSREARGAQGGPPTDVGTAFVVVEAERGPVDEPVFATSAEDLAVFGGRGPYATGFDSLETHFKEGGGPLYAQRLVGGGAAAASVEIDGVKVTAASPGVWGDSITLQFAVAEQIPELGLDPPVAAPQLTVGIKPNKVPVVKLTPAGEGQDAGLAVLFDGEVVERALNLTDVADLVAWAETSDYIRVEALDAEVALPQGEHQLEGGDDGQAVVTDPQALLDAALSLDPETLGPGMLIAPGKHTALQHEALLRAADATGRKALLDASPTLDLAGLVAHAKLLRSLDVNALGGLWAQRGVIPGLSPGAYRTVPWSAVQAALCARVDAETGNPNRAAAGEIATCRFVLGLDRQFGKDERNWVLEPAGVNTARMVDGAPRNYGFRSLADPDSPAQRQWLFLNNARFVMYLEAEGTRIGESMAFEDATPDNCAQLAGALKALLVRFYDPGPLVSTNGEEDGAFRVLWGAEAYGNDESKFFKALERGEMLTPMLIHLAAPAEWILIPITKYALTAALV